jgi:hypothetical protein
MNEIMRIDVLNGLLTSDFMTSCGAVRYRVVRYLLSLIQIQHARPLFEASSSLQSIMNDSIADALGFECN